MWTRWYGKGDKLYFISGIHATFHLYEMDVESKEIRQITEGPAYLWVICPRRGCNGCHQAGYRLRYEIFLVDPASGEATQLTFINKNIYDHITVPEYEERWVKTTDNKDMLVWVVYPPNFDARQKIPCHPVLWRRSPECHQP